MRAETAIASNPRLASSQAEAILREELRSLVEQLGANPVSAAVLELQAGLERLCHEELQRKCDECGPFTRDQHEIMKSLTDSIVQRITRLVSRQLTNPPQTAEQEALLKLLLEPCKQQAANEAPTQGARSLAAGANH